MADLFDFFDDIAYNNSMKIKNNNMRIDSMEIKAQNWGAVVTNNMVTEKELKKLKKNGGFIKCPTRKAKGSKNARWGQVGK